MIVSQTNRKASASVLNGFRTYGNLPSAYRTYTVTYTTIHITSTKCQ